MKKLLFFIATALVFVGCEKKEYWEHVTPANPVIAHLMCIEITKVPQNYTCAATVVNSETGKISDRFNTTPCHIPDTIYSNGGLRLDRETYCLMAVGISGDQKDTVISTITIPQFRNGTLVNEGDTIGLKTEYDFEKDGYKGKWYIRFD